MKVSIIVFSPSGHTLNAAECIKQSFIKRGAEVQLINVTKNENYLNKEKIKTSLQKELDEHNILLIGGPVYAGHVERNVLNIIEQLPSPDEQFAPIAVPFVTYGGVHSSIALEEMGKLLKTSKRESLLGIKIAAEHTLTKTFSKFINENLLIETSLIDQAVEEIIKIAKRDYDNITYASKSFCYSRITERILFKTFTQESFHKNFKNLSINRSKCFGCKKCVEVCPVNMYEVSSEGIIMGPDSSKCILCGECYHNCPAGAIRFPYLDKAKKRLKDGNAKLEEPQSAIYM